MATETARRRVRAEITRLARADLDNDGFRLAAADVLRKAVGFDWWCWTLLDPAADLSTRYLSNNPIIGGAQRLFYRMLPDAAQPSPEWQSRRPVTILSAATGGDLRRSRLWRELLGPRGGGDQLVARLTAGGAAWAHLDLGRENSSGWFTHDDAGFMAGLAPLLAARLRAGLRAPADHSGDDSAAADAEPGTIILDRDLAPLLMRAWGLSARERDVASLAIGGLPSQNIGACARPAGCPGSRSGATAGSRAAAWPGQRARRGQPSPASDARPDASAPRPRAAGKGPPRPWRHHPGPGAPAS